MEMYFTREKISNSWPGELFAKVTSQLRVTLHDGANQEPLNARDLVCQQPRKGADDDENMKPKIFGPFWNQPNLTHLQNNLAAGAGYHGGERGRGGADRRALILCTSLSPLSESIGEMTSFKSPQV